MPYTELDKNTSFEQRRVSANTAVDNIKEFNLYHESAFDKGLEIKDMRYTGESLGIIDGVLLTSTEFSNDGMIMVTLDTSKNVNVYQLVNPYNVRNYRLLGTAVISNTLSSLQILRFNDDGTKMYMNNSADGTLWQYTLTTPYRPDIAAVNPILLYTNIVTGQPTNILPQFNSFQFIKDGTQLVVHIYSLANGWNYIMLNLAIAWDISNGVTVDTDNFTAGSAAFYSGFFDETGLLFYVFGSSSSILKYTLNTPYRLDDASGITAPVRGWPMSILSTPAGDSPILRDAFLVRDGDELFTVIQSSTGGLYKFNRRLLGKNVNDSSFYNGTRLTGSFLTLDVYGPEVQYIETDNSSLITVQNFREGQETTVYIRNRSGGNITYSMNGNNMLFTDGGSNIVVGQGKTRKLKIRCLKIGGVNHHVISSLVSI